MAETTKEGSTGTPIKQADFKTQGRSVHYRMAGSGPPLVLVHGYPESSRTWDEVIVKLADRYTLIAPDTRGTGESSVSGQFTIQEVAEDIHALVQSLGHASIYLAGQDFGVPVVAAFAALHREEIKALAVVESPLPGFGLEDLYASFWHFGFLASPFAEMLVAGREREFFSKFAFGDFVHRKEAFPPEKIEGYIADQMRPGRLNAGFAYYRALAGGKDFFTGAVAPPWDFPVLAIDGDHGMNGLTGQSFTKIAPHARTVIVPDCGHFVQEEQPDFLAKTLAAFFV